MKKIRDSVGAEGQKAKDIHRGRKQQRNPLNKNSLPSDSGNLDTECGGEKKKKKRENLPRLDLKKNIPALSMDTLTYALFTFYKLLVEEVTQFTGNASQF